MLNLSLRLYTKHSRYGARHMASAANWSHIFGIRHSTDPLYHHGRHSSSIAAVRVSNSLPPHVATSLLLPILNQYLKILLFKHSLDCDVWLLVLTQHLSYIFDSLLCALKVLLYSTALW